MKNADVRDDQLFSRGRTFCESPGKLGRKPQRDTPLAVHTKPAVQNVPAGTLLHVAGVLRIGDRGFERLPGQSQRRRTRVSVLPVGYLGREWTSFRPSACRMR